MVNPLTHKLLRELWTLRSQVLTIALVVSCGVACYVGLAGLDYALSTSIYNYYRTTRYAELFVSVRRAPEAIVPRLRAIDGVRALETRIVSEILLDIPGMPEPAAGRVLSLPPGANSQLNQLQLLRGRWLDPKHPEEVLANAAFADAHRFALGATLHGVLNGRRQQFRIVGVVLSPEFIYTLRPGEMTPDDRRYGVFFLNRTAMAAAFDLSGAFNDASFQLTPGASLRTVQATIDRELAPYGSRGSYDREHHPSHRLLFAKQKNLASVAQVLPFLFLAVAAFLVNVVLARMVGAQREQIAALKALGYTNTEVATHYASFVLVIVALGSLLGTGLGVWLGVSMVKLYGRYFRMPSLVFLLQSKTVLTAVGLTTILSLLGTMGVLRRVASLPPAEAMRPESPPSYEPTILERLGFHLLFSQAARMILRDMERRPARTALAVLGIAFGTSIMVAGRFSLDGIDFLTDVQFRTAQHEDLTVTLSRPSSRRALEAFRSSPGVLQVESMLTVPVRLRNGAASRETILQGLEPRGRLRRVFDTSLRQLTLPPEGIVLSSVLAERLHVQAGETITIELLQGSRAVRRVAVAAVVNDLVGLLGYMDISAANRLIDESNTITEVLLTVDPLQQQAVFERCKRLPFVSGVARKDAMLRYFREQSADILIAFTTVLAIVSSIIAIAVVYNSARIALAMRSRDLASLRVLGFTSGEVAAIVIGEQLVQVFLAIPPGLLLGYWSAASSVRRIDPEVFRLPLNIATSTYATAALVTLVAGLASALLVRRRVDQLDMLSVLKARD